MKEPDKKQSEAKSKLNAEPSPSSSIKTSEMASFVDNRVETAQLQQLQELADKSSQSIQLKALHQISNTTTAQRPVVQLVHKLGELDVSLLNYLIAELLEWNKTVSSEPKSDERKSVLSKIRLLRRKAERILKAGEVEKRIELTRLSFEAAHIELDIEELQAKKAPVEEEEEDVGGSDVASTSTSSSPKSKQEPPSEGPWLPARKKKKPKKPKGPKVAMTKNQLAQALVAKAMQEFERVYSYTGPPLRLSEVDPNFTPKSRFGSGALIRAVKAELGKWTPPGKNLRYQASTSEGKGKNFNIKIQRRAKGEWSAEAQVHVLWQ